MTRILVVDDALFLGLVLRDTFEDATPFSKTSPKLFASLSRYSRKTGAFDPRLIAKNIKMSFIIYVTEE